MEVIIQVGYLSMPWDLRCELHLSSQQFRLTLVADYPSYNLVHCLELLRQSIQCYGSTTLIPTRFMDGLGHLYIDSDQVHTCRSFPFLQDWVRRRKTVEYRGS